LALLIATTAACGDDAANNETADASITIDGTNAIDGAITPDTRIFDAKVGPDASTVGCTPVSGTPALQLEEVARNLTQPIVIAIPDGEDRIFVAEKGGKIRI